MIMEGCQAKPKTPTISEKVCPQCGNLIELFSIDTQVPCCGGLSYAVKTAFENCGKDIPLRIVAIGPDGNIVE